MHRISVVRVTNKNRFSARVPTLSSARCDVSGPVVFCLGLLEGWQGWWTSGVYDAAGGRFQWGTGEVIEDDDVNWGFQKRPFAGTCVWLLQVAGYNHMWGNYDCDTRSGVVCEIRLPTYFIP